MGEMTEERWREIRDSQRREYNRMVAEIDPPTWEYDAIQDLAAEAERALAEIDRLRADNERLTAVLQRKSDHAADLRIELQFFIDREGGRIPKETAWPEWFSKNYPNRAAGEENERLRAALQRIERVDNGQCGDWAHDALNPEATSDD